MNPQGLFGVYRAQVVDVRDEQKRMRCKVHVFCIHGRIVSDPANIMYWAEVANHSGKYCGDFFAYEVGDLVLVQFIDGQEQQPLIISGWNSNSGNIPDIPDDKQTNYRIGRRRWTRMDRDGNMLELSQVPGENHVLLSSGGASIKISRLGDAINVETVNGIVKFNSAILSVKAARTIVESSGVDISANRSNPVTSFENGAVAIRANKEVSVVAENNDPTSLNSVVNIGGRIDDVLTPHQTVNTNIHGKNVSIGSDTAKELPTLLLDMTAETSASLNAPIISIGSPTTVKASVDATKIDVGSILTAQNTIDGILITIGSLTNLSVVVQSSAAVTVKAPLVTVSAGQFNVGPYVP